MIKQKNPIQESIEAGINKMYPQNKAEIGDRIIIVRGENENIDGIHPVVVAVRENCVYACHGIHEPYPVDHGGYIIDSPLNKVTLYKTKLERWREEEMELLYELQEDVANENPGKDASRYWDAKHAYDKQKLKIETIKEAMDIAGGK